MCFNNCCRSLAAKGTEDLISGDAGLYKFWIPSALMGVGIAIDVAVATVARFRNADMRWGNWTLPIATTHILFPAVGYYLWWWLGGSFAFLLLPLGLIAAALVAAFLYEQMCAWADFEPVFSMGALMGLPDDEAAEVSRLVAILAVSVDAAASGPAKAAVAAAFAWSAMAVFWSFIVAGVVVALIAQVALLLSGWLRTRDFKNAKLLAGWFVFGSWLEASVIGGFGVLSFWTSFSSAGLGGDLWISIALSAVIFTVLFMLWRGRIYRAALNEIDQDTD